MDTDKNVNSLVDITAEKNFFDDSQKLGHLISNGNNIAIIPGESHEAIASSLALFYILKEQNKNANIIQDQMPENLKFLSPSIDFISYPKNFVISIPEKSGAISKIYYERNNQSLKIHFQLEEGNIKKEDIACYFQEPKPDLVIALGVIDYSKELKEQLNAFGFLLGSPILNIDNHEENKKFGKINLVEKKSLSEIILSLFPSKALNKKTAECLLTSLLLYTNNYQQNITAEIFELTGLLIKKGADFEAIRKNLTLS